ncbi:MAG TPA: hypothetical protein VKE49_03930 [Myxococcaceae bacterium]|nr:hypothetical protein [Myxococcaceae bacterium]
MSAPPMAAVDPPQKLFIHGPAMEKRRAAMRPPSRAHLGGIQPWSIQQIRAHIRLAPNQTPSHGEAPNACGIASSTAGATG